MAHIAKKAFKLNINGEIVAYNAGDRVKPEHAEHWLAKESIESDAERAEKAADEIDVEELIATNHRLAEDLAETLKQNSELKAALAAKKQDKPATKKDSAAETKPADDKAAGEAAKKE